MDDKKEIAYDVIDDDGKVVEKNHVGIAYEVLDEVKPDSPKKPE